MALSIHSGADVEVASSSSSIASISSSQPQLKPIKMPYTPTSAMSSSAVHISETSQSSEYPQLSKPSQPDHPLSEQAAEIESTSQGPSLPAKEAGKLSTALPSPPLTRVSSNESRSTRGIVEEGDSEEKEMDITAWKDSADDVDELPLEESEPNGPVDEGRRQNKGPIRPLQVSVAPAAATPPLWEIIVPPSPDGRRGSNDIESQRYRMDTFGSRAESSKRLIPKSSYYYGPPSTDAAFGTKAIGQIGVHHPREIVRIERDYSGGELIQFASVYPLEFEGRISATRFLESINLVNEILISAHSLSHSFLDNALAFFTLQISRLIKKPHYEKEMQRLKRLIDDLNTEIFNPVGLNMKWPRRVAFMFLEIEYYYVGEIYCY